MRKTSVYLPEALKAEVARAARRTGTSEAAFIRRALEAAIQQAPTDDRSSPTSGRWVAPSSATAPRTDPRLVGPLLVGVGVGPGTADLLTPRARHVILRADTVLAAAISRDAIGRAEATVRAALGPIRVERVALDVLGNAQQRDASSQALAERVIAHLDRDEVVAFLTLGDPSVFSAFADLARRVHRARRDLPIHSVPGIMAFQELASRAGTVVGGERQSVRIVALQDDGDGSRESIADSLARPDETLVLYRGGHCVSAIAEQLVAAGRAEQAVVGELLGLQGERCAPALEYLGEAASYLATLIAPAPGRG